MTRGGIKSSSRSAILSWLRLTHGQIHWLTLRRSWPRCSLAGTVSPGDCLRWTTGAIALSTKRAWNVTPENGDFDLLDNDLSSDPDQSNALGFVGARVFQDRPANGSICALTLVPCTLLRSLCVRQLIWLTTILMQPQLTASLALLAAMDCDQDWPTESPLSSRTPSGPVLIKLPSLIYSEFVSLGRALCCRPVISVFWLPVWSCRCGVLLFMSGH